MAIREHPSPFWGFVVFVGASIGLLVAGHTLAVLDYDLTVRLGLRDSVDPVNELSMQVNRAFGTGDTVVYMPLLVAGLAGLIRKRHRALLTSAAMAGIPADWSVTVTTPRKSVDRASRHDGRNHFSDVGERR